MLYFPLVKITREGIFEINMKYLSSNDIFELKTLKLSKFNGTFHNCLTDKVTERYSSDLLLYSEYY